MSFKLVISGKAMWVPILGTKYREEAKEKPGPRRTFLWMISPIKR